MYLTSFCDELEGIPADKKKARAFAYVLLVRKQSQCPRKRLSLRPLGTQLLDENQDDHVFMEGRCQRG